MFEVHLLEGRHRDTHRDDAGQDSARQKPVDAARCNHNDWLSTDGDAIRCCQCHSQLVMLPYKPGEFRMEWLSPAELAIRDLKCVA